MVDFFSHRKTSDANIVAQSGRCEDRRQEVLGSMPNQGKLTFAGMFFANHGVIIVQNFPLCITN